MNCEMMRTNLIGYLGGIVSNAAKTPLSNATLVLPYPALKYLLQLLKKGGSQSKGLPANSVRFRKLRQYVVSLRKDLSSLPDTVLSSQSNSISRLREAFGKVLTELYTSKGNHLTNLIQLENSLSQVKEQLAKLSKLAENSISAYGCPSSTAAGSKSSDSKPRHNSKLMLLLTPIQSFVSETMQRVNSIDKELHDAVRKSANFMITNRRPTPNSTVHCKAWNIQEKELRTNYKFLLYIQILFRNYYDEFLPPQILWLQNCIKSLPRLCDLLRKKVNFLLSQFKTPALQSIYREGVAPSELKFSILQFLILCSLHDAEFGNGVKFSLILKAKQELTPAEQRIRENFLRNPIINSKVAQCVKTVSGLPSSSITPSAGQHSVKFPEELRPDTASSYSVTELEDFVYNVLHGIQEEKLLYDKDPNQDVSLDDLLAASKQTVEHVDSPLATSTGCIRDMKEVGRRPEAEFDPKKVKKIEFSDDKLKEHIKDDSKLPSNNETIDRIALSTLIRNQPDDKLMRYKDYVRMCNKEKRKRGKLQQMLGSDLMTSHSFMSSFEVPDDIYESYSSLHSKVIAPIGANLGKGRNEVHDDYGKKQKGTQPKDIYKLGEVKPAKKKESKKLERLPQELSHKQQVDKKNEKDQLSQLLRKLDARPKSREKPSHSHKQSYDAYADYGAAPSDSFCVPQINNSFVQNPKIKNNLKRSKSIISFNEKKTPVPEEKSLRQIVKTKSVRNLQKKSGCHNRKSSVERNNIRLPLLSEEKRSGLRKHL